MTRTVPISIAIVAACALALPCAAARQPATGAESSTRTVAIHYRAHDGARRIALVLLPDAYVPGTPIPLVISPHGRGETAVDNAALWGDLPAEGNFAVVNPEGEGRRLSLYSWGDPGQIEDLARMPQIVRRAIPGLNVDRRRVFAFGGSMGGQETLLLIARHPHLLAGAAAFDPPTDMARRYRDFLSLRFGLRLRLYARVEIGGTPASKAAAYAARSPDHFASAIAASGVPLQLFYSLRDRIISDQVDEAGALYEQLVDLHPKARVWRFKGGWRHTAEMHAETRLPRALARFGLLPWSLAPEPPGDGHPV